MIKKRDVLVFLRAFFTTAVVLLCLTAIYLGCCRAYESVRKVCFGDPKPAVVLAEKYVKFFDLEIVF